MDVVHGSKEEIHLCVCRELLDESRVRGPDPFALETYQDADLACVLLAEAYGFENECLMAGPEEGDGVPGLDLFFFLDLNL